MGNCDDLSACKTVIIRGECLVRRERHLRSYRELTHACFFSHLPAHLSQAESVGRSVLPGQQPCLSPGSLGSMRQARLHFLQEGPSRVVWRQSDDALVLCARQLQGWERERGDVRLSQRSILPGHVQFAITPVHLFCSGPGALSQTVQRRGRTQRAGAVA